jgi:hypothetical protein
MFIPYKLAKALAITMSKDPTRPSLNQIGVHAITDDRLRLESSDGYRMTRLQFPNSFGARAGERFAIKASDILKLCVGIANVDQGLQNMETLDGQNFFPSTDHVVPFENRTPARIVGFDPLFLKEAYDVIDWTTKRTVHKEVGFGFKQRRASNTLVKWSHGAPHEPVVLTWTFGLTIEEHEEPERDLRGTIVLMPKRID